MRTQIERLFHELADMTPELRHDYYAAHVIGAETRSEVESLLSFDSSSSSFTGELGNLAQEVVEGLGTKPVRCGPYRLRRLLGRGGMGSVYSAERADGEITQQVAVKLLRPG